MKILTASQMREVDRLSTERYGIPSLVLMENAGSGVVRALESHFPDLAKLRVAICCGKGNNGGDGFVVARHLILKGMQPLVLLFAAPEEVRGDAAANLAILQKMGVPDSGCAGTRISPRNPFRGCSAIWMLIWWLTHSWARASGFLSAASWPRSSSSCVASRELLPLMFLRV